MSDEFIDSNVFVYLFDKTDHHKRAAAERLVHSALQTRSACISFQVVQETLNVLTGTLPEPMAPEDAARFLEQFLVPLWQISPSTALYRLGLDVRTRYGYSFYDSLIVAAALDAGCTTLYSEDLQHGQQIQRLTIVNPFLG